MVTQKNIEGLKKLFEIAKVNIMRVKELALKIPADKRLS